MDETPAPGGPPPPLPAPLLRLRGPGVVLLLIVLLGLALRLHTLGDDPFIEDEIYVLQVSSGDLGSVLRSGGDISHPPLWYLLLHFLPGVLSGSEFALRLPSALLGTLSIPLLYRIGKRLAGERTGPIAALLLALSLFGVFWSQNGRMYTAFTFFSLLSMDAYLRLGEGRRGTWLLYAASTGAALYTHYFAGLLVAVQVLAFPLFHRSREGGRPASPRSFLAAIALLLLASLPLASLFLRQVPQKLGPSAGLALAPPADYLLGFQTEFLAIDALPALLLFSAAAFGALVLLRQRRPAGLFVLLWLLLPLAVLYPLTAVVPLAGFRMVAFAQPALPLLAAAGVARLIEWRRSAGVAALALCVVASGVALGDVYRGAEEPFPWHDIARSAVAHVAPGDRVVMFPAGRETHFRYYVPSLASRLEVLPEDTLPRLRGTLENASGGQRVWILVLIRPLGLPDAEATGHYLANATSVAQQGERWLLLLYDGARRDRAAG